MKAKCCTSEPVGDTYQIILHCRLLMIVTHVEMERFLNFIFVCVFFYMSMVRGYAWNQCLEGSRGTG